MDEMKAEPRAMAAVKPVVPGRRAAFTLMEVMIASAVLFMCLFVVLSLVSNSLRSARMLQQHRAVDPGTINGMIYVQLINTNQVREGQLDIDLDEMYPGYKCDAELAQIGSNGLCQVDVLVRQPVGNEVEMKSSFLIYLPNLQQGGIGGKMFK
jgi:Tfp pilus assembly protein PilV